MKAKNAIGKIYVSTNAYLGVLKHFVEDSVKAVNYMFHRFDNSYKKFYHRVRLTKSPETVLKPMNETNNPLLRQRAAYAVLEVAPRGGMANALVHNAKAKHIAIGSTAVT